MGVPVAIEVDTAGGKALAWWCPGCLSHHAVPLGGDDGWIVSGLAEGVPTLTPAVIWKEPKGARRKKAAPEPERCHSRMEGGVLRFEMESTHWLAGRSVPMEPFDG
jgi:hypothetical protein